MVEDRTRLQEILNLTHEIQEIKDLDVLLEKILSVARRFCAADAGSIYLREGNQLKFSYTQNDTIQAKLPAGRKMIYSTFTVPINNKSISGYVANTGATLNIPDAYYLPDDAPYSFDKQYDLASGYRTRSMMTFPIKTHRGEIIGVLQLINALDDAGEAIAFNAEDEPFILYFADSAAVAIERAQMTRAIIMRMIKMAELRDPKETGAHVNRVAAYAVELYEEWARRKGIRKEKIDQNRDVLRMAAMMHDVGKIAISDAILKKPARLDAAEIAIMQQHTFIGARLFSDKYSEFDESSMIVALNHHEKWDGSGYPGHINADTAKPIPGYELPDGKARGKCGEEIPPFGRVVAIADVYDALSSKRVYKESWTEEKVLETLQQDAGTHFDPEMIDTFIDIMDVIRNIASRYPD